MTPEQQARENIDRLLEQAGWAVQNAGAINLYESAGVAVREFSLKPGHGSADYLLYVNRRAVGIVEAKPEGHTLVGVETQSEKYSTGLPDNLPAHLRPLPFLYQSTGCETRFTNLLDPDSRSRSLFAFHKPETLAAWLGVSESARESTDLDRPMAVEPPDAFLSRNPRQKLKAMPPLDASALWPVQERAIESLEQSLAAGRRRALVQMATGSGKTFMACNQIYRLIKHAGAQRCALPGGPGQPRTPDPARVPRLRRTPDDRAQVHRALQRPASYSPAHVDDGQSCVHMPPSSGSIPCSRAKSSTREMEELSGFDLPSTATQRQPAPVEYNPDIPIDTFDVIIIDECHRSIYNLWRQVLDYFDAFHHRPHRNAVQADLRLLSGRTWSCSTTTEQAVADGVNVDFDTYRIRTEITEARVLGGRRLLGGQAGTARPGKSAGSSWKKT